LSLLLLFTVSDYPFGIFELFSLKMWNNHTIIYKPYMYVCKFVYLFFIATVNKRRRDNVMAKRKRRQKDKQ
jgi:hypothetical protein